MTVLGFDNITYGYCMKQCVSETVLGGLVGVSAVFGVLGSIAFPVLVKRIGLTKTGLTGFGSRFRMSRWDADATIAIPSSNLFCR